MSVRKASDSNLTGKKYNDASAGANKAPDVVDAPTVGTVVRDGSALSVPFTPAVKGGAATNFIATSTPGGITGTSATSPILVQGLTSGTSYTFVVQGQNTTATGPASQVSNAESALANPTWQAGVTYNTTQNYVAATNVEQVAIVAFGGGFAGNSGGNAGYCGWNESFNGGGGGGGGAMGLAYSGVATLPNYLNGGSTHLITIGASGGGVTSVGNFLDSSGGGNATSKSAGNTQGGYGVGGNVSVGSGLFGATNYTYGGSGGSGGWGGENQFAGGNAGESPYGGSGGKGGNYFSGGPGGGQGGTGPGGGGGGGGGGGYSSPGGAGGGAGGAGRVIIYEKKSL